MLTHKYHGNGVLGAATHGSYIDKGGIAMKNATLAQGNQILKLILHKKVSCEQLQRLIASGFISDLLDADLGKVDRMKFQEVLGLPVFKFDKTRENWKLLEDVPFDGKDFNLEFIGFLKPGEINVNGEVMKLRAKEINNAYTGQKHAEWLMEHQDRIPKHLQERQLVFPGTVWRDSNGERQVLYLEHLCSGWLPLWGSLRHCWDDYTLLVCFRPSNKA